MIIVTIKTDVPIAELCVFEDEKLIEAHTWEAHRRLAETIHEELANLLKRNGYTISQIDGFGCFAGPGSFTGLRIGLAVANALAYALESKVVATKGDDWRALAVQRLVAGNDETIVVPEYGMPVNITAPRK